MRTLADVITRHGVDVDPHLDRGDLVPVTAGLQRQGDVIVIPAERFSHGTAVSRDGVAVVRGENGGNTHVLLADGTVYWQPQAGAGLDIGHLTVERGATAFLAHPEHGYAGIAPGTYVLRRQREQADQIRVVAD